MLSLLHSKSEHILRSILSILQQRLYKQGCISFSSIKQSCGWFSVFCSISLTPDSESSQNVSEYYPKHQGNTGFQKEVLKSCAHDLFSHYHMTQESLGLSLINKQKYISPHYSNKTLRKQTPEM